MSTTKGILNKCRPSRTIPIVLTVALLLILSTDSPVYLVHATPTKGFWTNETPRPVLPAEGIAAAAVASTIFVIGGNDGTTEECRNDAYSVTTNSWTLKSSPPVCVAEEGVVSDNGLVYVVSGICEPVAPPGLTSGCSNFPEPQNALQIYNPETDTWVLGTPIPTAVARPGVAVHDDKIFVVGGYTSYPPSSSAVGLVQVYDIDTGTWTIVASMPTPREGLLAATAGDDIFAIGGFTTNGMATSLVQEYNIASNTWTTTGLAPMPTARGAVMGGTACGENSIFVIGGALSSPSGVATNANEVYIPSLNEWITRPSMPPDTATGTTGDTTGIRAEGGTGRVGSSLFVIGGTSMLENLGADTNANQAFKCSNTVVGKMKDPSGLGVGGVTVSVSGASGLISTVLTAVDGLYLIDLPSAGTYTLSATTLTGTVATPVNVPDGTIVIQNLSS